YTTGYFPQEYVPTIFENYDYAMAASGRMQYDYKQTNKQIMLSIWDTAGQEEYGRLRPLCYDETDVVMIWFAIDSMDSFSNVQDLVGYRQTTFLPHRPRLSLALVTVDSPPTVRTVRGRWAAQGK
ncbi:ras family-domain-containing protein, partial [Trichophaea hybrida]